MGYKLQLTDNLLCLNLIHTVFICSHFSSITTIGIRLIYAYFITIFKTKPYTVFRMLLTDTLCFSLNICSSIRCIILSKGYVIIIITFCCVVMVVKMMFGFCYVIIIITFCSVCKDLINIKSSFDEIYNLPSETTCNLILLTVALFAIVNQA